jgi:hypothetical protein
MFFVPNSELRLGMVPSFSLPDWTGYVHYQTGLSISNNEGDNQQKWEK